MCARNLMRVRVPACIIIIIMRACVRVRGRIRFRICILIRGRVRTRLLTTSLRTLSLRNEGRMH